MRTKYWPNCYLKTIVARGSFEYLIILLKLFGVDPSIDNEKHCTSKFLWWFYLFNHVSLLVPTIHTFYVSVAETSDLFSMSWGWMETIVMLEAIACLLNFKYQTYGFKILVLAIKKQLSKKDIVIGIRNSNACVLSFTSILFNIVLLPIYSNHAATNNDRQLFMTAQYPFPIDSVLVKAFILPNQLFVLMHIITILIFDGICVLSICTCTMRLKMLKVDWAIVNSYTELNKLIIEHQNVISFIREINGFARFIIVKTFFSFMCYSITCGILIINQHNAQEMKIQYFIVLLVFLRICALVESGESLTIINNDIQFVIYSTSWYHERRTSVILKSIMIGSCQNLRKIYVNGFMPELNRFYLQRVLYKTFSYFMAIRAIMNKQ